MSESQHLAETLKRLYFGDKVGIFAPFEAATGGLTTDLCHEVVYPSGFARGR